LWLYQYTTPSDLNASGVSAADIEHYTLLVALNRDARHLPAEPLGERRLVDHSLPALGIGEFRVLNALGQDVDLFLNLRPARSLFENSTHTRVRLAIVVAELVQHLRLVAVVVQHDNRRTAEGQTALLRLLHL